MKKIANCEYIREIIDKTERIGYLDIQGDTLSKKQDNFKSLIQKD